MIVIADKDIPHIQDYLGYQCELILKPGRELSHADVKDADILIVRSVTKVNAGLLAGSKVKYVGSVATGHDHLDLAYLQQRHIAYATSAGFNAPGVADYIVCLVASLQRRGYLNQTKCHAAVIGLGRIGTRVANYLRALGMNVLCCDPLRAQNENNFNSISLQAIQDVDLITLHVPLTKDPQLYPTYHFINEAFLSRQKDQTILVNTSRGGVIDTSALTEYGKHLLWCFDVWEHEPAINLACLQQTLLGTPHIAGYTVESKPRGIRIIYEDLCARGVIQPTTSHPGNTTKNKDDELCKTTIQIPSLEKFDWREVVLKIFDPQPTNQCMKETLLSASPEETSMLFDALRLKFKARHEFAHCQIAGAQRLTQHDQTLLKHLGIACI